MITTFSVGDRIRVLDNSLRTDTFREIQIDFVNHRTSQYEGFVVRDVCVGKDVQNSSLIGFRNVVAVENTLRRDWPNRISLVEVLA